MQNNSRESGEEERVKILLGRERKKVEREEKELLALTNDRYTR